MSKIIIFNRQIIESMQQGKEYDFTGLDVVFEDPYPNQSVSKDRIKELSQIHPDTRGVIIGDEDFDKEVIDFFDNLKIVSKWGQGMDNIDIPYLESLDIVLKNCPGLLAAPVADLAVTYLLVLTRKVIEMHNQVIDGLWPKTRGIELGGKVASIIGLGNVGREVAKRLKSFGVSLTGFDPYPPSQNFIDDVQLELYDTELAAMENADFVLLCCNLTKDNFHLLDKEMFNKLKTGVFMVNVGRGVLIDEDALMVAMDNGTVAGIAMDVYESEPLPEKSPLRSYNQVVFGTHSAGQTHEAVERVNITAIANLDPLRD